MSASCLAATLRMASSAAPQLHDASGFGFEFRTNENQISKSMVSGVDLTRFPILNRMHEDQFCAMILGQIYRIWACRKESELKIGGI